MAAARTATARRSRSRPPTVTADILWQNTDGQVSIWEMDGNSLIRRRAREPQSRAELESDRKGRFLWRRRLRHPVAEHGHRPGLDLANEWEQLVVGRLVNLNPGPTWHEIGTGDFNGDGLSDILWQNTSTGQVSIWEIGQNGGPESSAADP